MTHPTATIPTLDPPVADLQLGPARPRRVMFLLTSMPIGGAETLLVNLIRRLDPARFAAEVGLLKEPGPLGAELAREVPVHTNLLAHKFDLRVLPRLCRLLRAREIDTIVTVGAGDKMFWGRLAARLTRVPVILSALHSTGWPDGVGRLNRLLTSITDGFIAVAPPHGRFLVEFERFPAEKVHVIPNGVDTSHFAPLPNREAIRQEFGLSPTAPVVTIVAALRPEKNHEMFLEVARRVSQQLTDAQFLVVGDGPRQAALRQLATELGVATRVHFLGSRSDVPRILTASDVFALTSHNEANPVSILESLSTGCPVVATDVGSVRETVLPGETGYLVEAGDAENFATRLVELLNDPLLIRQMGQKGRQRVVDCWSVEVMVRGYEDLMESLWAHKLPRRKACERP